MVCGGDGGEAEARARGVLEVGAHVGEVYQGHDGREIGVLEELGLWPRWAQDGWWFRSMEELIVFAIWVDEYLQKFCGYPERQPE